MQAVEAGKAEAAALAAAAANVVTAPPAATAAPAPGAAGAGAAAAGETGADGKPKRRVRLADQEARLERRREQNRVNAVRRAGGRAIMAARGGEGEDPKTQHQYPF